MSLIDFQADLTETNFQLRRIADALELLIPVPPVYDPKKSKAELYQITPKGRWEAEKEDRQWRKISDQEAAVMPRR